VLLALQGASAAWLEALPANLHDSPAAQALEAIVALDLDTSADTDPRQGYRRDFTNARNPLASCDRNQRGL
jgi:hypothetical protein